MTDGSRTPSAEQTAAEPTAAAPASVEGAAASPAAAEPAAPQAAIEAAAGEPATSASVPVPCAAGGAARAKLSYLLTPKVVKAAPKVDAAADVVEVDLAIGVVDAAIDVVEGDLVACEDADVEEVLRAEVRHLRELLARHTTDLPPTVLGQALKRKVPPASLQPTVLGIRSGACSGCRALKACTDRVFAESGQLFCEQCWAKWERSGWWRPNIRVSCAPPLVLTPGSPPQYGPHDAFFVPSLLCERGDLSLFEALKNELPAGREFGDWHGGRHQGIQFQGEGARHDCDSAPPVLRATIAKMEAAFGIKALASRLNLYRSNEDFKPLHFDRGRGDNGEPQVTVGASFGATRELLLCHVKSGVTATFPQRNGDVFAFTPELNMVFTHGVPKIGFGSPSEHEGNGPRLSLILWGGKVGNKCPNETS